MKPGWAQTDNGNHRRIFAVNWSSNYWFVVTKNATDNILDAGWIYAGTDYRAGTASYALNEDQWNVLVVTWDTGGSPNKTVLRLNGSQIATNGSLETSSSAGAAKFIGRDPAGSLSFGPSGTFDGYISYVGIWDRVLGAGEVAALELYVRPELMFSGLVYLYDLMGATPADVVSGESCADSGTTLSQDNPAPLVFPQGVF